MLAASLNAFFCASPIYGSAEDFTFLLDVTVSREVTPAAKQQIGETRKKRLAKRLAFFRFDNSSGIIKGEQPLIRASRASKVAGAFLVLFWHAKENLALPKQRSNPAPPARTPAKKYCASPYRFATAISARFSSRMRSSTVFTAVSTSAFGMRATSTAHA